MTEEKRIRLSWLKNFEPEKLSTTELPEREQQKEFNGGDYWEVEDEEF